MELEKANKLEKKFCGKKVATKVIDNLRGQQIYQLRINNLCIDKIKNLNIYGMLLHSRMFELSF